jgi:hypothetical protein
MPESFSVLIHELRGLCLDTQLLGGNVEQRASRARDAARGTELVQPAAPTDDLLAGSLNII